MLKRLIILFLLYPAITFAQFTDDFEDGSITDWTESTAGRWAASDISPLNGSYSLHHIFDNDVNDHDQVSVDISDLDLNAGVTTWRFKVKYSYNPYSTNNWSVFITSNAEASEMHPSGSANGYALGVDYTGTDDLIKLWKITSGSAVEVVATFVNWASDVGTSNAPAIEVVRSVAGEWKINYNLSGDFNSLVNIGSGSDATYNIADYFGVYYKYTSGQDLKLWIDDIEITGELYVDTIPPRVDSVYVQSYKKLKVEFNEKIDSASAVNPVNYFVDGGIGSPDSVVVDKSYQYAELFFNQQFADNQLYAMDIKSVEDLSANVIQDTIVNFKYEYIKPLSVEVISANQIQLEFSRNLDTVSAENPLNYTLDNGAGNPILAEVVEGDSAKVQLQFGTDFINKSNYNLSIQDVADRNLDSLQTETILFVYFVPEPFDVVVNEIMADPSPVVNLPEYEYIEIKNSTEFSIDLTGWKLKVGTSIKDFPDSVLASSSYVILCSATAADSLETFGDIVKFASFPSLSNSGSSIIIYDKNNLIVDSVNYTANWYNDTEKEDGGWSIERIDPLNVCSSITNWTASVDSNGGTPGAENSVFASNIDTEAPQIDRVELVTGNQLKLIFNEPVTEESLLNKLNYSVSNGIGNPISVTVSSDLQEIDLTFLNTFPEKTNLELTIENLTDECGNAISSLKHDFVYYIVQPYDIVINEIMADPEPAMALPEFEYLEIYNTSDYSISLTDWTLTVGSTIRTLPMASISSGTYLVLCSEDAATEFQGIGDVLAVTSFPSLANTEQTVILRNKSNEIISRVSYSDDWYQNEFKAEGGWSLEQIDPLNPCGGENNWIASVNETGGTPGQENSVYASNPDLDAPKLLRITLVDEQNIQLFFNESIDSLSAMQTGIYTVDNSIGKPVSVDVTGPDYTSLILGFNDTFNQNVMYTLEIAGGIFDCAGNEIADNNTASFSVPFLPEENDLVINEILFNPLPEGFDFIEIYNRSEKTIDLQDVLIASYDDEELDYTSIKVITEEGFLVFPGEYVVLTESPEAVQIQYTTTNSDGFVKLADLPGYNDDKGHVFLLDKQQNIIDNFAYDEDMQFALLATNEGVSLERINFNRPTDDKTNWHSASQLVGFATPAYENSQFMVLEDITDDVKIEPEVFSPDNDGFEDVTNISFIFNEPGYVANIKIYDSKGRLIKYLANNKLLGIDGIISWDGLDDKDQKAPVGIYIVYIEIFDLDGNVKQYKKSLVVAAKY